MGVIAPFPASRVHELANYLIRVDEQFPDGGGHQVRLHIIRHFSDLKTENLARAITLATNAGMRRLRVDQNG